MVTQDAAVLPKVKKMKVKKMKKKAKKKKMKGADNIDSESEADKLDLEQKIYPMSHYISDQEELVNQMFLTISGSKLEAMLPPVLKSMPLTELKRLCIHELRGMSKKRILCCINGEVMEGSSGSEDEEDDKEEADAEDSKENDTNDKGEKRKPGDDQAPEPYLLKKIKVEPGLEGSTGNAEGKSVLELLELEMRARIIKTMLEKGDEGKKITEDAIAAVMQSAKQITKEGTEATGGGSKEATNRGTEPKDDTQGKDSDRDAAGGEEATEERSRGKRKSQGKEGDRRRRPHRAGDGKRNSSRSQKRDGSYSDEGSRGRSSKKQKEPNSSEKQVLKKKKITRKEFEERMKRAKKNRTYRQRKSSEDEEKTRENEDKPEEENSKEDTEEKTGNKTEAKTQDAPTEGNIIQNAAEGEASEKEEGEIDSNEEEEGACSPTDVSSASHYSSSSSYSRSRSRSYSRSPNRGRQRKSRKSGSRSRSKKGGRSYSRSYSRSRSPQRRKGTVDYQSRSYERKRSREPRKSNSKSEVKKSSPAEDRSPSREEDWGHKCDIEFVDSEEDFDDNPESSQKDAGQKAVPNRIERASISFSLQKKPVGIAQSVDLDDLPLKKKQMDDDIEALSPVKPSATKEEIVISSDSEVEVQGSTQGSTRKQKSSQESKTNSKDQTVNLPVTSITSSKLSEARKINAASIKGNIDSQANQEKVVKKTGDSETKIEAVNKEVQEEIMKDSSKLAADAKKDVTNVDKAISKEECHTRDTKLSSKSVGGSESASVETVNVSEDAGREIKDISPESKQDDKSEEYKSGPSMMHPTEALSDGSEANAKDSGSDTRCEEGKQDGTSAETLISGIDDAKTDENCLNETEITKSSSKQPRKRKTERRVNAKHDTDIHAAEERGQAETEAPTPSETRSQTCKDKKIQSKAEDTLADSEREETVENNNSSVASEQKKETADNKDITIVFGGQSEEDFYKGTEQLGFHDDDKESEEEAVKELHKKRTPVEPIRLETGLIRKRVQRSRKIEMVVPERSWMKRDKKKKEKTKDILAIEGLGLLKSTLSEGAQSSPQDSEMETETSQSTEPVETPKSIELVKSPCSSALVSDTENSQPLQDLRTQKVASPSPKRDTSPEASQSEDKSMRKIDHDTEIIGVIETKDPSDNFDDMDLGGSSWSMRWLQSEKVQKVVTSSKMLSRVRKKIQKKEKATKVVMAEKVEEAQKPADPVVSVIGSIEEYERLFGTKVKKDEAAGAAGSVSQDSSGHGQASGNSAQAQGDIPEAKDKGNPVFGSDDDGEDSEEEALWSKIIKK